MIDLADRKPSATEQAYLDQGYNLPEGWTWKLVDQYRQGHNIDQIYVPIQNATALALGLVVWGVPYIDGRPLTRPDPKERPAA